MTAPATPKLTHWFGRHVRLNVDTSQDGDENFRTIEGKVISASESAIVIRARGGPIIVEANKIIGEIEEVKRSPRRRAVIRSVREIGPDDSARQHLVDRHGIMVSVANAASDDVLRTMHSKINHDDLGHRHGVRPGSGPQLEDLEDTGDDE